MKRAAHLFLCFIFLMATAAWMFVVLHPVGRGLLGLHWSIPGVLVCLICSVGCLRQALRRE